MRLAFVTGYPYTVESYWRVLIPARHFRAQALSPEQAVTETPDTVWIHHPMTEAAVSLAQAVKSRGGHVVVDFSEDLWTREALGEGLTVYTSTMLKQAEQTVDLADTVVTATEGLAALFDGLAVEVIPPVLASLPAMGDTIPGNVVWWSDGRQKGGWEQAAPHVTRLVKGIGGRLVFVQFAHMVTGLETEDQAYVMGGSFSPDTLVNHYLQHAAKAELGLECWPDIPYRESVSDLTLLRYAACGVPALTTRDKAPPGSVSAPYEDWPRVAKELHEEPGKRRAFSMAAREWAASRVGFGRYHDVITALQ